MSKTIVTKLVSPPLFKTISVDCANCWTRSRLHIPVEMNEGEVECDVCGAKTEWQEVDNENTNLS